MKYFLILITLLTFSTAVSAQSNTTKDWVECRVKAGTISCPRLKTKDKALRIARLGGLPTKGEFFIHLSGHCGVAFTAEDYDREKFVRQPANVSCEDAPLYSTLKRRRK